LITFCRPYNAIKETFLRILYYHKGAAELVGDIGLTIYTTQLHKFLMHYRAIYGESIPIPKKETIQYDYQQAYCLMTSNFLE